MRISGCPTTLEIDVVINGWTFFLVRSRLSVVINSSAEEFRAARILRKRSMKWLYEINEYWYFFGSKKVSKKLLGWNKLAQFGICLLFAPSWLGDVLECYTPIMTTAQTVFHPRPQIWLSAKRIKLIKPIKLTKTLWCNSLYFWFLKFHNIDILCVA